MKIEINEDILDMLIRRIIFDKLEMEIMPAQSAEWWKHHLQVLFS